MISPMKTTPQSSQFNPVGDGRSKEIDLPRQRTDYGQIDFDRQAKSELNQSTQTRADGGCSI
jgi:hypothetical protein